MICVMVVGVTFRIDKDYAYFILLEVSLLSLMACIVAFIIPFSKLARKKFLNEFGHILSLSQKNSVTTQIYSAELQKKAYITLGIIIGGIVAFLALNVVLSIFERDIIICRVRYSWLFDASIIVLGGIVSIYLINKMFDLQFDSVKYASEFGVKLTELGLSNEQFDAFDKIMEKKLRIGMVVYPILICFVIAAIVGILFLVNRDPDKHLSNAHCASCCKNRCHG